MLKDFSKENFDIFIQAGQSNSEGFGVGYAYNPFLPDDRIWYMTRDFIITPACEYVMYNEIQSNYSLSFARKYIEMGCLDEGRKILILRTSVGSTGFINGHWAMGCDCFEKMMEMCKTALQLNSNNKLKGLLWHQGENDAVDNATYEGHLNNITQLLKIVRKTFGVERLPFIAGDFAEQWKNKNYEKCKPVIDAIKNLCISDSFSKFVDTNGLRTNLQENCRKTQCGKDVNEDDIHFSRQSLYELGERYFDAYKSIIERKEV